MLKTAIGIVVFLLLVGTGYFILNKGSFYPPTASNSQSASPSASPTTDSSQSATTITYTDDGFSPSKITVKMGSIVTVKNTSKNELQFNSDPHPAHTDDTELNIGEVASSGTKTFVANKMGTFGFHNHVLPIDTGTITVQ